MPRPVVLSYFSQSGDSEKDPYLKYLEAEYEAIVAAWEMSRSPVGSEQDIAVEFPARGSANGNKVEEDVRNYKNRLILFHFSGHAMSNNLLFKDGASHARGIAGLLGEAKNLKLVVLNACATYDQVNLLFENNVKIVIATKGKVKDGIACEFADAFYKALSTTTYSIQSAYEHALNVLKRKHDHMGSISTLPITWRGVVKDSEIDRDRWELYVNAEGEELMEDLNWWQIGELSSSPTKRTAKTLYTDGQAAVPEHFKGREEELATIGEKFKAGGRIVILRGEGGVGKTTLATKFVEEYANQYDNKAWVFCKGGIVEDLKNLINDPTYFQDCVTEEQTVRKLRMTLLNMPESTLLVLDNMNNPDDIHYFLKQFRELRWHVVITSRYGAELKGEIPVKPLPDKAAKELFREFFEEESPDFENLLDQVLNAIGYNTLLIEIFAKNLREAHERQHESMAGFLKKFEKQGLLLEKNSFKISTDWLDNVHKAQAGETATINQILEVLYDFKNLRENETERYWLVNMALLTAQSYKVYFLEELWWDTEENICQTYLEPLAKKGWLTFENYTYHLSPVVQELVLKKNANTLPADAGKLLQNLGEKLANDGYNFTHLTLTQAAPFALLASSITQRLCSSPTFELALLNFNAGIYFENTGDVVQTKQSFEMYRQISAAIGNDEAVAISYRKLGGIYEAIGDQESALENYNKQLLIFKEIYQSSPKNLSYKNGLAISYEKLGGIYEATGDWENALENYQELLRIFKEIYQSSPNNFSYKNGLAISHFKLGSIYEATGDWKNALENYQEDFRITNEIYQSSPENLSYKNGLAISYEKLGGIYEATGDWENALKNYQERNRIGLEIYQSSPENLRYKNGLAISYLKLGSIYEATGVWEKALENYQERNRIGLEIYQSSPENLSYKNGLAVSYYRLGKIEMKQNKVHLALKNLIICHNLLREIWVSTQGKLLSFTSNFAEGTIDLTEILKELIIKDKYEEQYNYPKKDKVKSMRRKGYIALQLFAEAGILNEEQNTFYKVLADESWYEF